MMLRGIQTRRSFVWLRFADENADDDDDDDDDDGDDADKDADEDDEEEDSRQRGMLSGFVLLLLKMMLLSRI